MDQPAVHATVAGAQARLVTGTHFRASYSSGPRTTRSQPVHIFLSPRKPSAPSSPWYVHATFAFGGSATKSSRVSPVTLPAE